MKYSHSHGIGDWLMMDQYMTDRERDSIEVIYYSAQSRNHDALRELIEANPAYRHVKHSYLPYITCRLPGVVSSMANAGLLHRMKFTGSSFVKETLATIPFELPDRYDFLHLHTPFNIARVRADRDMKPDEWAAVLQRLDDRETHGVVINSDLEGELPEHSRLIDLRGKTSLPQAIEILKRSSGFIGIDSCLAIICSQLFKSEDILIRTRNPHVVEYCHEYYPCHEMIDFLTPAFGKARYPSKARPDREKGTLVELRCNTLVGIRNFGLDERCELPNARASELIALGRAVPYTLEK